MKILIKFLFWYRSKNRAKRKKRQNRSEQPRFSSVPFQKWVFVGRYLQRRPQIPSCTLPQTDVSRENMPKPKRTFHLPSINFQIKNRYFQVKEVFSKPISILYSVHFLCLLSIWRALLRSQRQDSVSTIKAWHAKTTSVSLSKHLLGGFNPWINASIISPIWGLKLQTRTYLYFKKTKHQIVLPNEQENTHPQHIFPNQIKHQVFSTAPSSSILKKRQEDPCCRSSGDPELRIHYKVDPKKNPIYLVQNSGYVIKPQFAKMAKNTGL